MTYNKYPKGSEWRRWDLHIHTPETNKNDSFAGDTTEEKWENFCDTINAYTEEIAVIGITDYFSIENYFKFKELIKAGNITKNFDLVLPNVELRISPITGDGKPINLHCIFNPEIETELNDRFFSKLKKEFNGSNFSGTKGELIRFGRSYEGNQTLSEAEAYKAGVSQYVVEVGALKKIFEEDNHLRDNTIIAVSNNSGDGATGLAYHSTFLEGKVSQLDATRRSLYQFAEAIFSANPKDRAYFLGKGADTPEVVISKCGSLKPCIHGCDAHKLEDVFKPSEDRFCWIKADPTFEGLKQVLYEPEDRVSINEEKPDEKLVYNVIEKVTFQDPSFTTQPILLNENLVTIIGGKSTGKSILLKNIAKTIDIEEYEKRIKTVGILDSRPLKGMEVVWKDGQTSSLGNNSNPSKRIIYIPQSYLNRVVDDDKQTTDIDQIIRDVLLQDDSFREWYTDLEKRTKSIDYRIEEEIKNLYENISVHKSNNTEIKNLGDEDGIVEQLKKLQKEVDELQKKLNLSPEDLKKYNEKSTIIKGLQVRISDTEKDIKVLEQLQKHKINTDDYSFDLAL